MGSLLAYSQLLEIIGNLLFQRLRLGKVDDRRIDWFLQVDDRLDDIAVAETTGQLKLFSVFFGSSLCS